MRKWYGETEKLVAPKKRSDPEGYGPLPDEDEEDAGPRDAVLVTGAETPLGELIVLQLVLARCAAHRGRAGRHAGEAEG